MMSWQVDSLIIILVHKGKMQLILNMMGQECHTKMPFRKLWKAIGGINTRFTGNVKQFPASYYTYSLSEVATLKGLW